MNGAIAMTPTTPPQGVEDRAPNTAFWCSLHVGSDTVSRSVPHVNNAEYIRWVDRAAELAIDHVGYTRQRLIEEDRMWFVVRHELNYRAECFVDDELLIATWVREYSRTTSLRDTVIYRPADDRLVFDATTRWAFIDLSTRRPIRIPAEVQDIVPATPFQLARTP